MPHTTTEKMIKEIVDGTTQKIIDLFVESGARITSSHSELIKGKIASSLTKLSESIKREMVEKVNKLELFETTEEQAALIKKIEVLEIINNLGERGE